MLYYVFETEEIAEGAEQYISQLGGVPIPSINAETGEIDTKAVMTERWATPKQRLDGKWVFPYVGDEKVSQYPSSVASYFEENFPNTKEEYNENWFPVEEGE